MITFEEIIAVKLLNKANNDHKSIDIKTGYILNEITTDIIPIVYEEELQNELHQ